MALLDTIRNLLSNTSNDVPAATDIALNNANIVTQEQPAIPQVTPIQAADELLSSATVSGGFNNTQVPQIPTFLSGLNTTWPVIPEQTPEIKTSFFWDFWKQAKQLYWFIYNVAWVPVDTPEQKYWLKNVSLSDISQARQTIEKAQDKDAAVNTFLKENWYTWAPVTYQDFSSKIIPDFVKFYASWDEDYFNMQKNRLLKQDTLWIWQQKVDKIDAQLSSTIDDIVRNNSKLVFKDASIYNNQVAQNAVDNLRSSLEDISRLYWEVLALNEKTWWKWLWWYDKSIIDSATAVYKTATVQYPKLWKMFIDETKWWWFSDQIAARDAVEKKVQELWYKNINWFLLDDKSTLWLYSPNEIIDRYYSVAKIWDIWWWWIENTIWEVSNLVWLFFDTAAWTIIWWASKILENFEKVPLVWIESKELNEIMWLSESARTDTDLLTSPYLSKTAAAFLYIADNIPEAVSLIASTLYSWWAWEVAWVSTATKLRKLWYIWENFASFLDDIKSWASIWKAVENTIEWWKLSKLADLWANVVWKAIETFVDNWFAQWAFEWWKLWYTKDWNWLSNILVDFWTIWVARNLVWGAWLALWEWKLANALKYVWGDYVKALNLYSPEELWKIAATKSQVKILEKEIKSIWWATTVDDLKKLDLQSDWLKKLVASDKTLDEIKSELPAVARNILANVKNTWEALSDSAISDLMRATNSIQNIIKEVWIDNPALWSFLWKLAVGKPITTEAVLDVVKKAVIDWTRTDEWLNRVKNIQDFVNAQIKDPNTNPADMIRNIYWVKSEVVYWWYFSWSKWRWVDFNISGQDQYIVPQDVRNKLWQTFDPDNITQEQANILSASWIDVKWTALSDEAKNTLWIKRSDYFIQEAVKTDVEWYLAKQVSDWVLSQDKSDEIVWAYKMFENSLSKIIC